MAVEIVPAALAKSFNQLEFVLSRLRGISPLVQVDVVADIFEGAETLPLWEEFDFEFDLFVEPAPFVARALELGASRVVVHERFQSAKEALGQLQNTRTGDFAVAVGLGLRAGDSPHTTEPYAGLFDYVQVMGIRQEGEQGHPPAPEAVELVSALRAAYPEMVIQVDGAVAPRAKEFREAGADRLVIGSAIVKADDPKGAYKDLYNRANGAQ